MAKFITNITLQDADENDYINLYRELGKESFKSEKFPDKMRSYVIEKGRFIREGSISIQEVTNAVSRAAAKTGRKYSFFIVRDKLVSS